MAKAPTDGTGHRARLRKRLIEGGHDALLDHELVEYLLTLAIPRRDTKPLAKRLIDEFGGLGALLSAEPEALARIGGLSEGAIAALMIAKASALRLLSDEIREKPILSNWQALIDYLRADMAHEPIERVRVLHLDSKNVLIRDEIVTEGSIDQAAIYVREIIRRAIDLHASGMILVHNHPSGDPSPSKADIRLTREVAEAARPLNIAVHDHLIIGAKGQTSLRSQGLI
ncbi:MAG: RadC family protein [Parasphingopyxis sp.]|uniref:RadC family protein n=1 Tax=Parasphingopyxis sp. TaxID=1920299 RepID=UPI003FA0DDFC